MGEAARRWLMEHLTQTERFDLGLELSDAMMQAVLRRVEIPSDATPEEAARLRFRALREAGR